MRQRKRALLPEDVPALGRRRLVVGEREGLGDVGCAWRSEVAASAPRSTMADAHRWSLAVSQAVRNPPYEPPITPIRSGRAGAPSPGRLHRGVDIGQIDRPPTLADHGLEMIGTGAARAPRVGGDDAVPGAHPHLELVEERRAVCAGRAAVDVEQQGNPVVSRAVGRSTRRARRPGADLEVLRCQPDPPLHERPN